MKNVLVIEDDHIMLKAIRNILTKGGYNVLMARDGKEAFELLDNADYDAIITDLMLPYANGLEVVSRVRKNYTKKNVGIIVVSSMGHEEMVTEAFSLGADDYLKKPIMAGELLSRMKRLLLKETVMAKHATGNIDDVAPVIVSIPVPEAPGHIVKSIVDPAQIDSSDKSVADPELTTNAAPKIPDAVEEVAALVQTAHEKALKANEQVEEKNATKGNIQKQAKEDVKDLPAIEETTTGVEHTVTAIAQNSTESSLPETNLTNPPIEKATELIAETEEHVAIVNDPDIHAAIATSINTELAPIQHKNETDTNALPLEIPHQPEQEPVIEQFTLTEDPNTPADNLTDTQTGIETEPDHSFVWKPEAIAEVAAILQPDRVATPIPKTTGINEIPLQPADPEVNASTIAAIDPVPDTSTILKTSKEERKAGKGAEKSKKNRQKKSKLATIPSKEDIENRKIEKIANSYPEEKKREYNYFYLNIILVTIVIAFIVIGVFI